MFSVTAKFFIVIHLYTSFSARSARTNILGSVLGCLLTWCIDIAISPLDEVFLDLLRFGRLIISCSFARQIFILGSYILLNSFLLILPFPLFKTYWGEGMRTVGLETSRLRPRLEVLVNFGLFLLLIFSAVVFDRSFVDLLLMSIYWARIFWYTSILKQNSLALLPISDIFPSRLRPVTCFLCWHLGKREESSGSRSTFVECCKPVVNWPCYLCIVKESPLYPTK